MIGVRRNAGVLFSLMLLAGLLVCTLWATTTRAQALASDSQQVLAEVFAEAEPKIVPISSVIPCNSEDFRTLPMVLASIANQTVYPHETLLIVNIPKSPENGVLFMDLSDEENERISIEPHPVLNTFKTAGDGLKYILNSMPTARESVMKIPNLRIFVRTGQHWAGNQRWWGANQTRMDTDIVSFFDCDDFMHPQRFEFVYRTFEEHEELEALVHSYETIKMTEWAKKIDRFLENKEYPSGNETFQHSYKEIWDSLPVDKVEEDGADEPNKGPKGSYIWWYPKDMHMRGQNAGHNGWLSVKRSLLREIPYPDIRRGQDSLFNWRLIKARKNFNHINVKLGGYIRYR